MTAPLTLPGAGVTPEVAGVTEAADVDARTALASRGRSRLG
jgi:hypothetical protein